MKDAKLTQSFLSLTPPSVLTLGSLFIMDSIRAPQALAELKLGAYTKDWPSIYAPYIIASFTLKHQGSF